MQYHNFYTIEIQKLFVYNFIVIRRLKLYKFLLTIFLIFILISTIYILIYNLIKTLENKVEKQKAFLNNEIKKRKDIIEGAKGIVKSSKTENVNLTSIITIYEHQIERASRDLNDAKNAYNKAVSKYNSFIDHFPVFLIASRIQAQKLDYLNNKNFEDLIDSNF